VVISATRPRASLEAELVDAAKELLLGPRTSVDWTYVSPPAVLEPGQRTGRYRVGLDHLVTDAAGASSLSMEDFALALVDEAERPQHSRGHFTVGT
jgi:putative NADH-flavin reductase